MKRAEETSFDQDCAIQSSDAANDWDFLGEDWVIVKKQKVNILMPTLPGSSQPAACNPTFEQLHEDGILKASTMVKNPQEITIMDPLRELDKIGLDHPAETGSEERLASSKEKPIMEINPPNGAATPADPMTTDSRKLNGKMVHNSTRAHHGTRTVKQWRLNDGVLFSKMMKASNLERKLLRAGGLSRWLASVGLEQFIRVFRAKKISKFQLVNLSMMKLKDMGVHAVGPRRKLMHAIECVCHPYCFEAL